MALLIKGWSPRTPAEAKKTLEQMRRNVRESLTSERVLVTARKIADAAGARDEVTQARLIRQWLCDRFKFLNDPLGIELLEAPSFQINRILARGHVQGDCDDAATVSAALLLAIGIPCQFITLAFAPSGPWAHVYTVGFPRDWKTGRRVPIEQDITLPAGMPRPRAARTLTTQV